MDPPRSEPDHRIEPRTEGPDADLYAAALTGDRSAVGRLVARYHHQLTAYGIANGWPRSDSEDAAQLAWMRFFQHVQRASQDPAKTLRKPESLRFWLITTTLNALRQEHRTARRQEEVVQRAKSEAGALGQLVDDPDYLGPLEEEEQRSLLRTAFTRLTSGCKELVTLLLIDPPLSYSEISEVTGRPKGSIGPTRRRCIDQLRSMIDGGSHV